MIYFQALFLHHYSITEQLEHFTNIISVLRFYNDLLLKILYTFKPLGYISFYSFIYRLLRVSLQIRRVQTLFLSIK